MTRKTIAVVGCGHLGTIHARLLAQREDVELVAVVDPFPASRDRVAAAHGCRALSEPAELIGVVSAAVIAAPTGLHAAVALPLLEAGIDLLIEKPLAATVEDARNIVTSARRQGRTVAVGHVERFNPAWELAVDRAGRINYLEASRLAPFTFRSLDVGVVHDLMIHDIDLVLELAASPVVRLAAAGGRSSAGPIDYVNATLGFANGVVASLTASKMAHRKIRSLSAHCRSSLMETDFLNHNLRIYRRSHESVSADHGELVYRNDGFIEEVSTTSIEPLYAELEHFLQCVRGREKPAVDGLQASRALQLADLIEQCVEQPNLCMTLAAPV